MLIASVLYFLNYRLIKNFIYHKYPYIIGRGLRLGKSFSMSGKEREKNWKLIEDLGILKALEYILEHPEFLAKQAKFNIDTEEVEHNDVYIYKTLRYPPKSTPPTAS